MIEDRSVLAIIPARGGSKRLPNKNMLPLAGKPLIGWTINSARESRYIDRCIVSSDSRRIAEVAEQYGCDVPFIRPAHLATDETTTIDTILHVLETIDNYDLFAVLQPTSPLRTAADIDAAISLMLNRNAESCVSVTIADKIPYWMYHRNPKGQLQSILSGATDETRRRDVEDVYVLNGAIYVADTAFFLKERTLINNETISYSMPKERSIDIDDKMDLMLAEAILTELQHHR